jgi:tetratricopeptide (TPR) repeat protein
VVGSSGVANTAADWGESVKDQALVEAVMAARKQAGRELARLRQAAGLNQQQLAIRISYSRGQVAGAEAGTQSTAMGFWRACDQVLAAGGALVEARGRVEAALKARRDAAVRREEAEREARLQRWRAEHGFSTAYSPVGIEPGLSPQGTAVGPASILPPGLAARAARDVSIFGQAEDRLILYETLIQAFDALRVNLNRRRFLQSIGVSTANIAAAGITSSWASHDGRGSAGSTPADAGQVDPCVVDDIEAVIGAHRRLYRQFSAERLLPATLGHLRMASYLAKSASSGVRDRLVSSIAEASMLAGTLLYHDLGDAQTASAYYTLTEAAAKRLDNQEMLAYLLGCMSFLACYSGSRVEATSLIDRAIEMADNSASPETRAWLHAVAGEIYASAGQATASMHSLEASKGALGNANYDDPSWLGIGAFNDAKLDAYYGTCYLRLHDFKSAVTSLSVALDRLHPSWLKHRCTTLSDLALAHAGLNEVDAACEYASEAIKIILTLQHAVNIDRLKRVRQVLQPHATNQAVQELDAYLSMVA